MHCAFLYTTLLELHAPTKSAGFLAVPQLLTAAKESRETVSPQSCPKGHLACEVLYWIGRKKPCVQGPWKKARGTETRGEGAEEGLEPCGGWRMGRGVLWGLKEEWAVWGWSPEGE